MPPKLGNFKLPILRKLILPLLAFRSAGNQVTVSVTEDGIQFSSGEKDSGQTDTVTTGGNLNVRTGAGMDYTAFTQLPNGTTVKVIGTDGD